MQQGPAVLAMYPEYVDDANAYELIADADHAVGDTKTEAAILTAYEHAGGQMPDVLKRLAKLETAAGQRADAAATLERINYIYPVKDEELHRQLGDLLFTAEKVRRRHPRIQRAGCVEPSRQGRRRIRSRTGLFRGRTEEQGAG